MLIRPWKGEPNLTVAHRDYTGLPVCEGHGFLQHVKEMGAKGGKQSLLNKSWMFGPVAEETVGQSWNVIYVLAIIHLHIVFQSPPLNTPCLAEVGLKPRAPEAHC